MKKLTLPVTLFTASIIFASPITEEKTTLGLISKIEPSQTEPASYEIKIPQSDPCRRFSILSNHPVLITQKETNIKQASPELSIIRRYTTTRHRAMRWPDNEYIITITPIQKDKPTLIVFGKSRDEMPTSIEADKLNKKLENDLKELGSMTIRPEARGKE